MKTRCFIILLLIVSLLPSSARTAAARDALRERINLQGASPVLHLNLGPADPIIDPALADYGGITGGVGGFIANQLFLGLVRADEATGAPIPWLASGWVMSPEATVFTFTLRSGLNWTDGNPLTAHDARYGILRSLAPDTPAYYPSPLFLIQNAEEYNNGSITDPDLVGVKVLDYYHLQFTLKQPAAYFPSLLAWPMARPMPAWAIAAHPTDWTEPANIVTNGPYKLAAWNHGTSMTLEKNPGYYEAAKVQFGQVSFSMLEDATAWGMYQAGLLDSTIVPPEQWSAASHDPILAQQLHRAFTSGTFYSGFNTAKAPFDNLLVRKAFAAAVDRQELLDTILQDAEQPALTFTPPGLWGHVDGLVEGIGIPYDPVQARQWLAAAGFPNGQGLPPVTLVVGLRPDFIEETQALGESLRQGWMNELGADITVLNMEWAPYLELMGTDAPQVWVIRWWADYLDAYNFLGECVDSFGRANFGGWNNPAYNGLLTLAKQTPDLNTRAFLYRQAEEILVETDAVLVPVFYTATGIATRPTLERTYGSGGFGGLISDWYFSRWLFLPGILK